MSRRRRNIYRNLFVYAYLALPVLIFMTGWLKWYWALPLGVLTVCACIKGFQDSLKTRCLVPRAGGRGSADARTALMALLLIVLWVYLSGVGGYSYQNSDHVMHNTVFCALVECEWPVVTQDGGRALIYDIGFWLPAACVGKVFGLEAGYAAQFIWTVLGVYIVYDLICVYRRKFDLLPLTFLVMFSGLDYVGTCLLVPKEADLGMAYHLEHWALHYQFSSVTAQLFWVFHQAVPAWIATVLLLVQKNSKNMLLILSLILLTSTFPFVGLIPIAALLYIRLVVKGRIRWEDIFTFQNITGAIVIGGISFLYLAGKEAGGKIGLVFDGAAAEGPVKMIGVYLLFCLLEFGVYLVFLWKYRRKDPLLWLMIGILLVCPLIRVGDQTDFCMYASIPALFVFLLFCMKAFEKIYRNGKKWLFAAYCAILLIGAITPFNEIHRTVSLTVQRFADGNSVRCACIDIENELLEADDFSGEAEDSLFFRILAKR